MSQNNNDENVQRITHHQQRIHQDMSFVSTTSVSRRKFVIKNAAFITSSTTVSLLFPSSSCYGSPTTSDSDNGSINTDTTDMLFRRPTITNQYIGYEILINTDFSTNQKPVKTHLDEINLINTNVKGHQYGITIDPVKIKSLIDFGTPEQIAAKVVLAELNRDGISDVTLMTDPYYYIPNNNNDKNSSHDYLLLNYKSIGKRGIKRSVVKIYIYDSKLYVCTAQCKENDYITTLENDITKTINSFRLLS